MINKSPIARKLMILIVAFSATITIITTGSQLLFDYKKELSGLNHQIESIKTTQIDSLSHSIWAFDSQGIRIIIDNTLNIQDIEYLFVHVNDKNSWSGGELISRKTIDTTIPIHYKDGQDDLIIGSLRIVASLDNLYDRLLRRAVVIFIGNGVKTFFVSLFILFLFQRFVTRHLIDLEKYATEVAKGADNSPFRLNRKKSAHVNPDELDKAGSAINRMRENLQKEIQKIKQAEETLKANEEDLKESQKIARVGSWRLNISSNKVIWSEGLYKIYGFDPALPPPAYKEHQKLFTPESWKRLSTALEKTVETGISYELELEMVREDGSFGWIWVHGETALDAEGQKTGLKGVVQDITERKQSEEYNKNLAAQLVQSQKMESIGNLAGGIAHDFNNILSSIIGFTELALEAAPKGSSQRDDLEEVYIAGNRAKELVQQILAFARKSEEKTKPVRISDIVTEVLKLLRPSTPATIDIKPTIKSTAKVMGNASQLHQVVMNISTNAIHSLQKTGGVLEIILKNILIANDLEPKTSGLSSGEYIELTFTDNGSGIDPAIIENVFEPYFTTKGIGEGTGMGLAMVKGIIESYGGDIKANSKPGEMTSFVIRLPIATGKSFNVVDQVDQVAPGREHILFVDDEPPIARIGSRILESLGYKVTVRTSSVEALELFKEMPDMFDLVISDMTMPSMTGAELSIQIRQISQYIPIILCTGYSNEMNDEGAQQLGINAFTYKPITKSDLAKTVREVLDAC